MIKTLPSNVGVVSLIPGQGVKILDASWPKKQNIRQKQYYNRFNKDFKNGPHQKRNLKKKRKKNQICKLKKKKKKND